MEIGVGKRIQQGTVENQQSLNEEQKSTSDCFKKKCATVRWTNLESCMPRGSKDYEG